YPSHSLCITQYRCASHAISFATEEPCGEGEFVAVVHGGAETAELIRCGDWRQLFNRVIVESTKFTVASPIVIRSSAISGRAATVWYRSRVPAGSFLSISVS
ncbi:hypothetical protein ACHAW6_013946, partial [Cyclotella cf. meneghiniana]